MPKSVLVADDSVVIQKSIGITFAQEDFNVTYAGNGEEAFQKAKQAKPDLVLADIVMPKKNGYELCDMIRKDPQMQSIPVLLLAGTHEPFDEARGKAVGADGHVIKPFESQALVDRVKQLLTKGRPATAQAPAATPPPPAPPSPSSTIAGQSAYAAAQAPSPSSTIAGQMPTASREPPIEFDLSEAAEEAPASAESNFDFAFDQSMDHSPEPAAKATASGGPARAPEPMQPAELDDSTQLPAGDFWDFSEDEAKEPAAPILETAPPQSAPEPKEDSGAWGTLSDSAWDEIPTENRPVATPEFEFAEPAFEPAAEIASVPEVSSDDFGFDIMSESPVGETSSPNLTQEPTITTTKLGPPPSIAEPLGAFVESEGPPMTSSNVSLTDAQIEAIVTKVFTRVIERIAWEVVPELAEGIIKEELSRLTKDAT